MSEQMVLEQSKVDALKKHLTSNRAQAIDTLVANGAAPDARRAGELVDSFLKTQASTKSNRLQLDADDAGAIRAGMELNSNPYYEAGWRGADLVILSAGRLFGLW